jgi:HPr kinase/phosphorylase
VTKQDDPPPPEPISTWVTARDGAALWLHGAGVAIDGRGILILGASGSGKSSLALSLMALGANLIADDGLWLSDEGDPPLLRRPAQSPDLIESRGIGLIRAGVTLNMAPLDLIVDLDRAEPDRLPPRRLVAIGDSLRPLILGAGHNTLGPALILMLRHGRAEV